VALPLEVAIVGAGQRGAHVFGAYARAHPDRMRVVAVAEPIAERRERMARAHGLDPGRSFADWRELFARPQLAAAAIVATADDEHAAPALAALERGYHLLLEKPMAMTLAGCRAIVETAERRERILQIGHVLRYTPFYAAVHRVVAGGRLGQVQTLSLSEHVAHWHFAHSYVRGKWRSRARAAPLVLAKSCHDLDLMHWFAGRRCLRVASFGALVHYRPENAPPGAPARCTDGCPAEPDCPHSAPRFYARDLASWPWSDVAARPDAAERLAALADGPYGVCVYRAGNDQPDRQTALFEFEGGVQGTLVVDGFSSRPERALRVQGTRAELRGVFERAELELLHYGRVEPERIPIDAARSGHGGGDEGLLDHFTDVASRDATGEVLASGRSALESHRMGFAAERARVEGRVVEIE
jgi:predicted dehydrogenase